MAFYGCSGLTSVTIPNRVTSIGYYAFHDCSRLTNININQTKGSLDYSQWGLQRGTVINWSNGSQTV